MSSANDLADLHSPYAPLLRQALLQASPRGAGAAMDLACGPGLKSGWLAETLRPSGRLLSVDLDQAALHHAMIAETSRVQIRQAVRSGSMHWIAGAALALPLRNSCVDLCWCVAALRLFTDPGLVLHEVRRVLRPGGALIVASAEQRWVRIRHWPAEVALALQRGAQAADCSPEQARQLTYGSLRPADGLGDDLAALLQAAGFDGCTIQAFLLEKSTEADLLPAALPLANWNALRPHAAPLLDAAALAHCDALAAEDVEPEPATVLFVVRGSHVDMLTR
ncbi:MAG: class I SAM-dependent methyltransferase [Chloroflexales bacterium]|nr:class I SAM-dependent methyltransferase [Chloroflexales bacterium]